MTDLLQQIVNGVVLGAVYSLSGTGFAITYGTSRILNFAHGIFFAAGGFALYTMTDSWGVPMLGALLLTSVAVLPLAYVSYLLVIKPFPPVRGGAALIGTFAVSLVMLDVFKMIYGADPLFPERLISGAPLRFGDVFVSKDNAVLTGLAVVMLGGVLAVWHLTGVGRRMRALVQSRDAAMLIGIDPEPSRRTAFLWGAGLAAVAGGFFGLQTVVAADTALHATFVAFAVVIVAGLGNILGAAIVGFGMGVLEAVTTLYVRPEYTVAAPFVVMIAVLLLRPQGIFPRKA
jgi:branched-chain amino acid transport system permease protein